MSDDIDLFTDKDYDSLDFTAIDKFLRKTFNYVSDLKAGPVAMGVSYLVPGDKKLFQKKPQSPVTFSPSQAPTC